MTGSLQLFAFLPKDGSPPQGAGRGGGGTAARGARETGGKVLLLIGTLCIQLVACVWSRSVSAFPENRPRYFFFSF